MLKQLLCFVVALATVQATGELFIIHSPDSVQFHGNQEIDQSLLKEVFAAALGYTIKFRGSWSGMSITNPFRLPEGAIIVAMEGMESFSMPKAQRFPLIVDEAEETTWQALGSRVESSDGNTVIRMNLSDGVDALGQSALGELKPAPIDENSLKALSMKKEEDRKFLQEIQLLNAIVEKASNIKPDSKPDVYWLIVSEMRAVLDAHGENSTATKEAMQLLNDALTKISDAFVTAYDGQVITAAFTTDASQVRHTRSITLNRQLRDADAPQDEGEENKKIEDEEATNTNTDSTSEPDSDINTSTANNNFRDDSEESAKSDKEHKTHTKLDDIGQEIKNLAKTYTEDYPVIFNIMLWFGVIFFFALLAICITIADLDPGRDSIIYRMTSNRMKKDN